MVLAITVAMTGCGKDIFTRIEETANYNNPNDGNNGNYSDFKDDNFSNDKNDFWTEDESELILDDNGNTTKPSTTRPSTTKPTTTKPTTQKTVTVPTGVSNIIAAYNTAANKTKAHNDMKVVRTNDVEIVIDDLMGSDFVTGLANSVASSFMKDYNGQPVTEIFKNGRPTKDTGTMDLQYPSMLANDKRLFIPVRNKNYMCNLRTSDVISATATRLTQSTYKVVIKLKAESTDLNTPPAITTRGMDYFEQKVFDLQGFKFTSGTANYKNCVITGIVNADGYLDYAENKMSVSSTNARVTVIGLELDAKIHGDYVTTLKFTIY